MADEMPGWKPAPDALCARCHAQPVGPGGILCAGCRTEIEAANRDLSGEGATRWLMGQRTTAWQSS